MNGRATYLIALVALFVAIVAWRKALAVEGRALPLAVYPGQRQA